MYKQSLFVRHTMRLIRKPCATRNNGKKLYANTKEQKSEIKEVEAVTPCFTGQITSFFDRLKINMRVASTKRSCHLRISFRDESYHFLYDIYQYDEGEM